MSNTEGIGFNRQVNEEAARWFVEFRSGDLDASGRRAFDAWVRTSPEHLQAFMEVAALWSHPAALDPQRQFSIEELLASARKEADVIPLSRPGEPVGRSVGKSRWVRVTAATAAVLFIVGSLVTWRMFVAQQTYGTQVGEQRSLRLSDGSTVTLNSRSRARIEFTDTTRAVELLEGEALFRVAKDALRPFVVRADGTIVRAVGTAFDVNKRNRGTVVTVVEGRVAVFLPAEQRGTRSNARAVPETPTRPPAPPAQREVTGDAGAAEEADGERVGEVYLSAGEGIDVTRGAPHTPVQTNVGSATAWMQGRVILQSATLEEVAEEFNRYSTRRIIAEDHGATPFRLSGVFSTDPDFLIRYLHERADIQVRETTTEIHIVRTGTH